MPTEHRSFLTDGRVWTPEDATLALRRWRAEYGPDGSRPMIEQAAAMASVRCPLAGAILYSALVNGRAEPVGC